MAQFQGNEKEMRALNTYVKLMRAAESLTARTQEHLLSTGLTISQFGVLEALHHIGPLSQKDIGQKILRSSGNITMVIDNLEKRNLVRRERDENDRRSFIVRLTEAGNKLIRKIFPPHAEVITAEMNALTAAEQKTLGELCKKLGLRDKA
jgi:MarR family 2-MHQ and catechol resistance regulon transcriptional repressor